MGLKRQYQIDRQQKYKARKKRRKLKPQAAVRPVKVEEAPAEKNPA
jgi:hypothetical protein